MITPLILRQEVGALLIDAEGLAESPARPLEHGLTAQGTVLLSGHIPRHEIADALALAVIGELTAVVGILLAGALAGAAALHQPSAALGAAARHLHHQRHGKGTLRIAGAGQEGTEPALPLYQIAAAHRTQLLADGRLGADIIALLGVGQVLGKAVVIKLMQHLLPRQLALLHIIQPLLHIGGEFQVGNVREILLHPGGHRLAQIGDEQVLALLLHIAPVKDGGHRGCVGGGTADAVFLHGPDQRRLGIVGRRRGKVLAGHEILQRQRLALLQLRQGRLLLLLIIVIPALLIHGGIAGELQLAGGGPEAVTVGGDLHRHAVIDGVGHLAGQKAAPDQPVQPVLLLGQIAPDGLRRQLHVAGADGLVGVLRPGLRLILTGRGGYIAFAVAILNKVPGVTLGLVADAQRVGTHVGDQTHGALAGDVHALVQLLGDGHGTAGRHIQLAGCLLLHGGGGKRRRRRAVLVGTLYRFDGKGSTAQLIHDGLHICLCLRLVFLAVLPVIMGMKGGFFPVFQQGIQCPVLLRPEVGDLLIPVSHHAGGDTLDAAGGQSPADLLPHHR